MVKKAQLKIQQMTFMLIAVTLFFVLVGMFLLSIALSNIKESSAELCEKNALLLVEKIANSPEFSCESAFGGTRINCVDADKVMALKDNLKYYTNFWGVSGIEIMKIYPKRLDIECKRENYEDCSRIEVLNKNEEGIYYSNFVSLCQKAVVEGDIYDKCELAKIMIKYTYGEKC